MGHNPVRGQGSYVCPTRFVQSTGHGYRDTAPGTETVSNRREDAAQGSHADSHARRHREQSAEGAQTSQMRAKQAPIGEQE